MKKLNEFKWYNQLNAQMGCMKSCLDYLGVDVSIAWLYGGTGHAFVININSNVDPSDGTNWDTRMLYELAPNLGFQVKAVKADKSQAGDSYPARQREAWDFVRANIDRGIPCYGWELHPYIPDHFIITGYEDEGEVQGYYFDGCASGGPTSCNQLGDHDVKILAVYSVERCTPASDAKIVKDVLTTVVQRSSTPDGWAVAPMYVTGPTAFDLWEKALATGEAIRDSHAYIAAVWYENRAITAAFLQEARQRLAGKLTPACDAALADAQTHYAQVRDVLHEVCQRNPLNFEGWDGATTLQSEAVAALLHQAGQAEKQAFACLQQALAAWE